MHAQPCVPQHSLSRRAGIQGAGVHYAQRLETAGAIHAAAKAATPAAYPVIERTLPAGVV